MSTQVNAGGNCPAGTTPILIGGQTFCWPTTHTLVELADGKLNISLQAPISQEIAKQLSASGFDVKGIDKENR